MTKIANIRNTAAINKITSGSTIRIKSAVANGSFNVIRTVRRNTMRVVLGA